MLSGCASAERGETPGEYQRQDQEPGNDDLGEAPEAPRPRPLPDEGLEKGRRGIGRSGSARLSRVNTGDGSTPVSSTGCRQCPLWVSVRAELDQRARARERCRDFRGADAAVMAEQSIAHPLNSAVLVGRRRLDRHVAFRIESDRPIVQVRRAHAQQHIVYDHHFGVDHDVNTAVAVGHVQDRAELHVSPAGSLDKPHEPDASGLHDVRLEP